MLIRQKDGSTTFVPTWAVVSWTLLIGSLMAGGFWIRAWSQADDERRFRQTAIFKTSRPADGLRACLANNRVGGLALGRRGETWESLTADGRTVIAENPARKLRVEISDDGKRRFVRFITRDGRSLRRSERAIAEECAT